MILLLIATALVLSLWTGLDPPLWQRVNTEFDEFGRVVASQGSCTYGTTGLPFMIPLMVIFVGSLFWACYEAYHSR